MHDITVNSAESMAKLVKDSRIMPLLRSSIKGFSIEEHTPREYWFSDEREGPWEWKGPVIQQTGAMYGKFFHGKAAYIMPDLYEDFANYRRGGIDFDYRYETGHASELERRVYDTLREYGTLQTKELRVFSGFGKGERGRFDAVLTRLQMTGYVITIDFEYAQDASGKQYGWGIARVATPELILGDDFGERIYRRDVEQSKERLVAKLVELNPDADLRTIIRMVG